MANLKDIVETEKKRETIEDCRVAYLYREGGFYRAYEWSAWLFVRHVSDFKVTCRMIKSLEQPVSFIGFPLTSAGKFMPDGFQMTPNADGSMQVTFSQNMISDDVDPAALSVEFEMWKQALPVTESLKNKKERADEESHFGVQVQPQSLTQIMQKVLAYPIESKSPMESMTFLAEIKKQLSALI